MTQPPLFAFLYMRIQSKPIPNEFFLEESMIDCSNFKILLVIKHTRNVFCLKNPEHIYYIFKKWSFVK